jgi:hypothetical protein
MLACGHDREPFGTPMCGHVRLCREPGLRYLRLYTGTGMDSELLCKSCVSAREGGHPVTAEFVCQECFDYATTQLAVFEGVRGKPETRIRAEPFNSKLQSTALPEELGRVVDVAPILVERRSHWLLLAEDGWIARFQADTGVWSRVGRAALRPEPDHEPWCGRILRTHLHASPAGEFAAVVNDYGRYGEVIDLRSSRRTLSLDGGDYHEETVPFSFAFAQINGRVVAIHRTDWNRLDISDPCSGELLSERNPTSYSHGEVQPAHYLDYFHGAIQLSPSHARIVDDGWVWHPVGVPTTWEVESWIHNVWESEDGPTRQSLCARDGYWDHALTWLDDARIAIGGLGDDHADVIDGVRILDVSEPGERDQRFGSSLPGARELAAFAGPAGSFFSDGRCLFSSDRSGLARWDLHDGSRTGFLQGFQPTHHHRGARELVQVVDGALVRWAIDNGHASVSKSR